MRATQSDEYNEDSQVRFGVAGSASQDERTLPDIVVAMLAEILGRADI
jgi:hypothetical protein